MTTITENLTLGDAQLAGPLAVYPIFGRPPRLEYRGVTDALKLGALLRELPVPSVREVIIDNPTDLSILIYEGEHITGAQQNRSFDASVLVPAKSGIPVPVSCIERGRWDGHRHGEAFTVSAHIADPRLRGVKRELSSRPGGDGRPDQARVWSDVSERLDDAGIASSTDSLEDLFAMRSGRIKELGGSLELARDQLGAVVEIAGKPVALDMVSRPEVFAALAPALHSGYALLAADAEPAKPDHEKAQRFLAKAIGARRELVANQGLGHAFTFSRKRSIGSGVMHDGELIALSAFARESATA